MSSLEELNPMQKEAVSCTEGPLLVLAGAGSGKTRVLAHRIAYLIEEKKVNPWNILAITFTNKAAGEMRERVDRQVGLGSDSIWVSTFHSACVRILRRHIEFLGYTTHFTIYDTDDQKSLLKQVYKTLEVDNRLYREKMVLSRISSAKDKLITPDLFLETAADFQERRIGEIYRAYQEALLKNDALDFDDLIMKTVELFRTQPQVLDYYQERFRYILVDEYQDTNRAQFELVRLLSGKYKNICVVGDDDQSIYKFRGADIRNILDFEQTFPGAAVVKLEQNYRSTQNILDAANAVIQNNEGRKEKNLWTDNGTGDKLVYRQFDQAYEEAEFIVRDIIDHGYPYEDCAVLYRTNAQSRLLEEKCIACNVPYRLVGGVNFYERKEIKDILAYLKTVANGRDDVAVTRIVNVPRRGIGAASLGKVTVFAAANGYSLYDGMRRAGEIPGLGKASDKIRKFTDMIEGFRQRLTEEYEEESVAAAWTDDTAEPGAARPQTPINLRRLIEDILDETGYKRELEAEGTEEAQERLENIEELISKAVDYTAGAEEPSLDGFLEEVALVADVDELDQSEHRVTLMTLHSAKGLEFENVYLSGLEDGTFPSYMTVASDNPGEMEEERRLCYVGITRAKKHLTLTSARMRVVNGEPRYNKTSRFLEEIPKELLVSSRLEPWWAASDKPRGAQKERESGKKTGARSEWTDDAFEGGSRPVVWMDEPEQEPAPPQRTGLSPRTARREKPAGTSRFAPDSKPDFGKAFVVEKGRSSAYKVGDRVRHVKFGEGTVIGVEERPKDYEITVEFDTVGVRRIMASFLKGKEA